MTSRLVSPAQCGHLRHKGMYARPDGAPDDPLYRDPIEATSYWCGCTQKAFGPDGLAVSPESCGHGRGCCDH